MAEWLNTPLIVIAILATLTVLYKFSHWKGTVDSDLSSIKDLIVEIRADIKNIFQRLPSQITVGQSPLRLTEYGEGLSNKLNAQDWADRIAPTVLTKVINKQPFEIHNFCKEFVKTLSAEEHPAVFERSYEIGITDENMKIVLALVLRDELLKQIGSHA